ncbi:MAG: Gfo/Idh/MocA family oxidoreductase [Bacteroidota bacterium]
MKNTNGKLGVALLGLGKYATEQLAPALQETKYCWLAGIITGSSQKANQFKQKYSIPGENIYNYDNFDSIKDNPAIDIVYVVTPNALHAAFAVRAAKAGKHVICEKPMATTLEDCDRMIDACIQAGVTLSVGYRLHFEPYNQQIIQLATTHKYGYVQKVIARDGIGEVHGWRLNKQLAGGGALMDLGIYCVQAANYLFNMSPIAVTVQKHDNTLDEVEKELTFQLEYPGGFMAECACSYSKKMNYLHAMANNGWFELEPAFGYAGIKGKTSSGDMHFEPVNQQALEMDRIAQAILRDKASPVPGEMGREDIQILLAIYEAMHNGQRVILDPVIQASATTETGGSINGSSFQVQS